MGGQARAVVAANPLLLIRRILHIPSSHVSDECLNLAPPPAPMMHPHHPQVSRDSATAQRDTLHQYTTQVAHDLASRELAVRGANREDALVGMHTDLDASQRVVGDLTQRLSIANDEVARLKRWGHGWWVRRQWRGVARAQPCRLTVQWWHGLQLG